MLKVCRRCNKTQGYTLCIECRRLDQARHSQVYGTTYRRTRTAVLEASGYKCAACGAPANTTDHATPVAKGGTDDRTNLVALCSRCNSQKQDRDLEQFLDWRRHQHRPDFSQPTTPTNTPAPFRARPRFQDSGVA